MTNIVNISLPLKHKIRHPKKHTLKSPAIFFLHGFGSNMHDLFSLSTYFPSDWTCISLEGMIPIDFGGWAWAEIDFNNMMVLPKPEQMFEHRTKIIHCIEICTEKLKLDPEKIYLLGFSQGASISIFCGLTHPELFHGIVSLCGVIRPNGFSKEIDKDKIRDLNLFMANGTEDELVPIELGRRSKKYLEDAGVKPAYREYSAGHTISNECLQEMLKWLEELQEK